MEVCDVGGVEGVCGALGVNIVGTVPDPAVAGVGKTEGAGPPAGGTADGVKTVAAAPPELGATGVNTVGAAAPPAGTAAGAGAKPGAGAAGNTDGVDADVYPAARAAAGMYTVIVMSMGGHKTSIESLLTSFSRGGRRHGWSRRERRL